MRENNKKYGFVMSLYEFGIKPSLGFFLTLVAETIPTLWQTVRDFASRHPNYIARENSAHFMVDDPTKGLDGNYNLCHVPPKKSHFF
jgi:alpha 1,2-mannosyltransferase